MGQTGEKATNSSSLDMLEDDLVDAGDAEERTDAGADGGRDAAGDGRDMLGAHNAQPGAGANLTANGAKRVVTGIGDATTGESSEQSGRQCG